MQMSASLNSLSHEECPKHKGQPFILFCNEKQCQMMVCGACLRTKHHRDHNMIELNEKADEIKKKLQEFNKGSQKIKDVFDGQITTINEIIENINTTASTGNLLIKMKFHQVRFYMFAYLK